MTEKQLTIWRYVWFAFGVATMLTIRHFSHLAFEVLLTTAISGRIANEVRDEVRKKMNETRPSQAD